MSAAYLGGWIDTALRAEEECRQLRAILAGLVLALCRNQDFLRIARLDLPLGDVEVLENVLERVIATREANEDGLIEEADRVSEQLEADLRDWIEGSR